MKNYYIVNQESSLYWKDFYNDSIEWKKYKRINKNAFVRAYLYEKYDGICQFCSNPLKDNYMIHHTSYNHVCDYQTNGSIYTSDDPHMLCEECSKKSPDRFNRCIGLLRPVCAHCNMIIDTIAARLLIPSDASVPESQPGYYFKREEIIRMNQFIKWVATSNKSEFPKTDELQRLYKVFIDYNYDEGLYRIWGRKRISRTQKPRDIYVENDDMKLLIELVSWGITELKLKDDDFINFYRRLHMIDPTYKYYCFSSIENHMDEEGFLQKPAKDPMGKL